MKNGHIPDDMQYQIKEFCIYSYKGKTQYGYSKDTELCASSVMSQAVSARFFDEAQQDFQAMKQSFSTPTATTAATQAVITMTLSIATRK